MAGIRLRTASAQRRTPPLATATVLVLLAVLFLLQATSVRDKKLTYDAPFHLRYGVQILHGDATRFDDSKMPVSAWNAIPRRISQELDPGPLKRFLAAGGTARYPTMLASVLLAWLVFHWSRELYGLAAGLVSLVLHVFEPNLLAHGRLVTTDLYAALTVTLVLYTFWRFQRAPDERRAVRWAWGAASALAFGVAQVAKYTAAYLVPVLLLVAAVRHAPGIGADLRAGSARDAAGRLGRRTLRLATWSVVFALAALLVINAAFLFQDPFWPLADYRFRSEPFQQLQADAAEHVPWLRVPVPYPYLEGLDWVLARERTGVGYGDIYLLGETRRGEGFAGYFFVASLYKVPLPILVLWLVAGVAYAVLARRDPRFRFTRDEAVLLVPTAFFVVYFNFFFRAQIGIRHFLVVFPLLHVFAGCLLSAPVWGELSRRARRSLTAVGAALGAWLVVSVLSYYPHFLPYMNEILPDRKLAYHILADSNLDWGQDDDAVKRYLAAHPDVALNPERPTAGRILVGTNWLTGVLARWGREDRWIRGRFEPVDHFRYSHLIYEVTEEELTRHGLPNHPREPAAR